MSSDGSVTQWIHHLKAGDTAAIQPLWERYFRRLVGLARVRLRGAPQVMADGEDAALSALHSLCRGIEKNQFPQLSDRTDLWCLLVTLTVRKALGIIAHEGRQKRGGNAVIYASALQTGSDFSGTAFSFEQFIAKEPTPEFAAQMAEECHRLMASLPEEMLRSIVQWKMEGYTENEMAARLGCQPRTIRRKLQRIRALWEQEIVP